jgi:3-dehydroquinate synthase
MTKSTEIKIGNLGDIGFGEFLKSTNASKKVIITDETVFELWGENFLTDYEGLSHAEVIQVPPGEDSKSLEICRQIWESLAEYGIQRGDMIINFGGGMVSDLGGFVAAAYKRGINYINLPTTLLSMVDASVGGKTAVNLGPSKNQIGFFHAPSKVFIDSYFLATLPPEQVLSGFAEMLKHGIIADKKHFNELCKTGGAAEKITGDMIRKSIKIKEQFVAQDFEDKGVRKNLNFGHTTGHAIEGFLLKSGTPWPHGYCVAWGMVVAAYISLLRKMITESEFKNIHRVVTSLYPPLPLTAQDIPALLELMKTDKKNSGDHLNFTLITEIGQAVPDKHATVELVNIALQYVLGADDSGK